VRFLGDPFAAMDKKPETVFEEIGGVFSCQERWCKEVATKALYDDKNHLLIYHCKDGHQSVCEKVYFD
jgi:hypothetical protein